MTVATLEQRSNMRRLDVVMRVVADLRPGDEWHMPYNPLDQYGRRILSPGTVEYWYMQDMDHIFTCVASSLFMARMRRDEWMEKQNE